MITPQEYRTRMTSFQKKLPKFIILAAASVLMLFAYLPDQGNLASAADIAPPKKEYTGTPETIAHVFLKIEKGFGTTDQHEAYLKGLINRAMDAIPLKDDYTKEDAVATLTTIDAFLKKEGFTFKNNVLLNKGLDSKLIDCDNYSALYTSIAEILRIPIIPVYAPNHSFIRFLFTDGTWLNWEPIEGAERDNSYYIEKLNIAEESIAKGVYLKNLTRKEFMGVQYNNIGAYLMFQKKFKEAMPYFNTAIKFYPAFYSAYHNRGSSLYALGMRQMALKELLTAAGLDPKRADTQNTLGDIYFDLKEYGKARESYEKSIGCDPGNYIPYHNIAALLQETGKKDEAALWLKKADEIRSLKKGTQSIKK